MTKKDLEELDARISGAWSAINEVRNEHRRLKRHIGGGLMVLLGLVLLVVGVIPFGNYIQNAACEPDERGGKTFMQDGLKYKECVKPGRTVKELADTPKGKEIVTTEVPVESRVISWKPDPWNGIIAPGLSILIGAFLMLYGIKKIMGDW